MLFWTPVEIAAGETAGNSRLALVAGEKGLQQIRFDGIPPDGSVRDNAHPVLAAAALQLRAYFAGELYGFDLPLDAHGTAFQEQVWRELRCIPYGATCSYGQIATAIGSPKAVRAVGAANGRNPLPIVVPCHRVIGANGSLVGFGGGMALKKWLLNLERRHDHSPAQNLFDVFSLT